MIQKSRPQLLIVGICMIALFGLTVVVHTLRVPGIIVGLTGLFLIVWATVGKGRWCRQCKTFRMS
jgi:putative effector of murein hydrolase LrgA (UPF0299 family)